MGFIVVHFCITFAFQIWNYLNKLERRKSKDDFGYKFSLKLPSVREGLYVILFKTLVASKLAVALAFARLSDSRRKYWQTRENMTRANGTLPSWSLKRASLPRRRC